MPTLWTTGRLIGEGAATLKLVTRHIVGDRLQRAGVERAGNTVTAISPAVEERLKMHSGYRAVFFHTCLYMHQYWVAAAMAVENFFASQRVLHRPAGRHGHFPNNHFMIEGIALATKAAAVWRGNHANVTGRNF